MTFSLTLRLCATYDFEASAQRLGLLMTIDGSHDDKIKPQGLGEYAFEDADGGPTGGESDADEEETADIADVAEGEGRVLDEEDEEEAEDGMEDSDEDDDTAELVWVCGAAPENSPEGYTYAPCPPLETEEEQRALVGRRVLVAHVVDPIGCTSAGTRTQDERALPLLCLSCSLASPLADCSLTSPWARAPLCKGHVGRIRFFGVGAADRKVCPTANFVVRYTKKETNAEMKEGQQEARELSASNYGCNEWWLLLEPTAEPSAKRLRR